MFPVPDPPTRRLLHAAGHDVRHREVFHGPDAAATVERALADVAGVERWIIHAYVFVRDRFHLAFEASGAAPDPAAGLRLLLDLIAVRLNDARGRQRTGCDLVHHLRSIEDRVAFATIVDHIHLEPVRAGVVAPAHLAAHGASSLRQFLQHPRPGWLACGELRRRHDLADSTAGWSTYLARLMCAASTSTPAGLLFQPDAAPTEALLTKP